jgi:hypothetical protein
MTVVDLIDSLSVLEREGFVKRDRQRDGTVRYTPMPIRRRKGRCRDFHLADHRRLSKRGGPNSTRG